MKTRKLLKQSNTVLGHLYLGIDTQIHNSQGLKLYKSTSGAQPRRPNHLKTEGIPLRVQTALKKKNQKPI